jgi:hypothetical protein
MAISTADTGLKIVSMEPPRFRPPVTMRPPLRLFWRSEEHRASSTPTPTPAPTEDFVTIITNEVNSCQGQFQVFYMTVQDLFWIAQAITMALAFRVMAQSILLVTKPDADYTFHRPS